jgi:hypothetical protein
MPTSGDCLNCRTALVGRYCPTCGQDSSLALRPLPELVAEWSDAVLGWETRSGRTLRALLFEPGRLTAEYAAGHRAPWIHPLRIYLSASVAAFAVFGATNALVAADVVEGIGMDSPRALMGVVLLKVSAAMVPLLPVAAGCYALVLRDRRRYYAEHLVYVLHTISFFLIVQALASLAQVLVVMLDAPAALLVAARLPAHLAVVVYGFVAMRRVYGLGSLATALRLVAVTASFAPIMGVTVWLMAGHWL